MRSFAWPAAAAIAVLGTLLITGGAALGYAQSSAGFSNWAAVVVSGDYHAGDRGRTEAFDNARRDVSAELLKVGFAPSNLLQFSARPGRYPDDNARYSNPASVESHLADLAGSTSGGCLLYFTSHVKLGGLVMGRDILDPQHMAHIVDSACGARPTVVVISSCYSGIFIEDLKAPNRLIITAARPDRRSFGCGQNDRYPYFDSCVVESLPKARTFEDLAALAEVCVGRLEAKRRETYPSEPQLSVGALVADKLPALR
ncbi:MAG: peptidase C13 [Alphaproteobacteria bacterium]|nr:peptidase C13 [Alphaproteobacteria bacterium]